MKVSILYFSQTGNTRTVAETIAEEFKSAGYTVRCCTIAEANREDFTGSDLVGVGSPVFESHAPASVKNFLKTIPELSGRRSFVFATGGGAAGNVLSDMTALLKKKGSPVIGSFLALGEVHHPAPCIAGKSPGRPDSEDLNNAKCFALTLIKRMSFDATSPYSGLTPKKGFYNAVGAITSSEALIRLLEPKPKLASERCRQCRLCARECPMGNIAMAPYPVIGKKCIRCYRCMNVCKQKSFSVNWWLGNVVVFIFWNRFFMRWFGEYNRKR
jgi:flavodoxin/ferredoxin